MYLNNSGNNVGSFTLKNGVITGFHSNGEGGAIYANSGHVRIEGGTITENSSGSYGGGIRIGNSQVSSLTITGGTISNNTSGNHGGGIYFTPTGAPHAVLTITGGVIENNTAAKEAGGIYITGRDNAANTQTVEIRNAVIRGNESDKYAGICLYGQFRSILVEDTEISGNKASTGFGGGLWKRHHHDDRRGNFKE